MSISPIGDTVALVKLCKTLVSIAHEFTNAKEDYQEALTQLETVAAIASCFENLSVPLANQSIINAIYAQAQRATKDSPKSNRKAEKYSSKLDSQSSNRAFRNAVARLRSSNIEKRTFGHVKRVETTVNEAFRNIEHLARLFEI